MPNAHRGEIEACLDGTSLRLCLTLSALERAFNNDGRIQLPPGFPSPSMRRMASP